jgi:hypothetical protein
MSKMRRCPKFYRSSRERTPEDLLAEGFEVNWGERNENGSLLCGCFTEARNNRVTSKAVYDEICGESSRHVSSIRQCVRDGEDV